MNIEFYRIQDDGVGVAGNDFVTVVHSPAVPREFETITIYQTEYTVDAVSWEVFTGTKPIIAKVYLRQIGS